MRYTGLEKTIPIAIMPIEMFLLNIMWGFVELSITFSIMIGLIFLPLLGMVVGMAMLAFK